MGISAVIDSDGRVIALPNPDWSKSKKTEAVVTATVPIDSRDSFYAKLGDWIPAVCWLTDAALTPTRRASKATRFLSP